MSLKQDKASPNGLGLGTNTFFLSFLACLRAFVESLSSLLLLEAELSELEPLLLPELPSLSEPLDLLLLEELEPESEPEPLLLLLSEPDPESLSLSEPLFLLSFSPKKIN